MKSGSVAVVGAGIVGLSIAFRLAQTGWSVTVFEKGKAAGEASWAGAGMLAPGGEIESGDRQSQSLIEARQMYPDFVSELNAESGLPIDFQQNGGLDLAYSAADLGRLEQKRAFHGELGLTSKVLSPKEIRTFWPRVGFDGLAGGVFYPGDAVVDPREVTRALLVACRNLGVVFLENTDVERISVAGSHISVDCRGETSEFDEAVIAAGAWSNTIQVTPMPPLPRVEPVKGVLLGYRQPDQTCNTIVRRGHTYLLQRANGLLIAGASAERAGFNREISGAIVADLAAKASAVFPHLGETTPSEIWTGFRPYAEEVHVGRWCNSRISLAYGHYRNGILLAPHTAQQIAALYAN